MKPLDKKRKLLCINCSSWWYQFVYRINPNNPPIKCGNCWDERRQYTIEKKELRFFNWK